MRLAKIIRKRLALMCVNCQVCRGARKRRQGFLRWFVKKIDRKVCPMCRSYEIITGKGAYEPMEAEDLKRIEEYDRV